MSPREITSNDGPRAGAVDAQDRREEAKKKGIFQQKMRDQKTQQSISNSKANQEAATKKSESKNLEARGENMETKGKVQATKPGNERAQESSKNPSKKPFDLKKGKVEEMKGQGEKVLVKTDEQKKSEGKKKQSTQGESDIGSLGVLAAVRQEFGAQAPEPVKKISNAFEVKAAKVGSASEASGLLDAKAVAEIAKQVGGGKTEVTLGNEFGQYGGAKLTAQYAANGVVKMTTSANEPGAKLNKLIASHNSEVLERINAHRKIAHRVNALETTQEQTHG